MPTPPLDFLDDIEATVHDKLVQMARLLAEMRQAVTALLGRAKVVLEERVVLGADNGKVVGHCWRQRGGVAVGMLTKLFLSARFPPRWRDRRRLFFPS